MPWYFCGFIFVYEAAQIGHFCWSDINLLQYCWYTKHKTHNTQHTTTIMSHPIPSTAHPEALSSPSIATANLASDLGAATPYDYELIQGSRGRACTHLCQFPCLGRWYTSSKNREKVKALTLDGCQSIGIYNSQPRPSTSICGSVGLTEEGWNVCGGIVLSFGALIGKTKIKWI